MSATSKRRALSVATTAACALALTSCGTQQNAKQASGDAASQAQRQTSLTTSATKTPIKHVVVIFDENVSFDHYFGTYPRAANTDGTHFTAAKDTPRANTLRTAHLLHHNPNLYDPSRLRHSQAMTCDQNHNYLPEQKAAHAGRNDRYVQNTSVDSCTGLYGSPGLTMDYFDGNTVTAMWNYAQHFTLSDNFYDTTFGPSTPGAINLVSGQTHGVVAVDPVHLQRVTDPYAVVDPNAHGVGTMINDPDPAFDDCSNTNHTSTNNLAKLKGKNIGDLLNRRHVTWGWFQGGFKPTVRHTGTTPAVCGASHENIGGAEELDYSPHHNPFEYYRSTANPHHVAPSSLHAVGHSDRAHHQYDLSVFNRTVKAGNLPAVSFLKAREYQDGHAGYSDPIDEQHFLVHEINLIQRSKQWKNTAIVIAYDDSDGWYDHQSTKLLNASRSHTNDAAHCKHSKAGMAGGYLDRCGPGPRLPLLLLSPYARSNFVGHRMIEQTSIIKFVEQNWHTGRIGDASFDARAKPITGLFDFSHPTNRRVILKPNGAVKRISHF
jgi:phospholipase C